MSDYDSGLPIRTEEDGTDERVHVKIVDGTNPAVNQATVDSDKNLKVGPYGNRTDDGADVALQLSEEGKTVTRGDYEVDDNSEPSSTGLVAGIRSTNNLSTDQTEHVTSIENAAGTVRALDMSLHDESGEAYTSNNPLPVTFEESENTEIVDYNTTAAVAKDAVVTHDYTTTALMKLIGEEAWVSGSGKLKAEIQIETAAASDTYNTVFTAFNSTANPNIRIPLEKIVTQVAGAKVRIEITNRDNQAQDVYSTLLAIEKLA
jgi:hypothetical protein